MRTIERRVILSHWGNIKFEEDYDMVNDAAEFKGSFSTLDFNDGNPKVGKQAFRKSVIKMPYSAWGFSYRDELGNITTSTIIKSESQGMVQGMLRPRFGLLGGWNCSWYDFYK